MEPLSSEILERISKLASSRERYVLEMRLGINSDRTHTLQEIADKLEVSRERVRQIQNRALSKLSAPEINSMLLLSEIGNPPRKNGRLRKLSSKKKSQLIGREELSQQGSEQFIVITFYEPTKGKDPFDGSSFVANRHKVKADWARQDGLETLFITDGEVVASWPTKTISGITWPTGIDIPTNPAGFANRMEEIKSIYPKAWSKWSFEEEQRLIKLFESGKTVADIAKQLMRAPGGIFSRLKKIELIDELTDFSEELTYTTVNPIITGSVYELINSMYQVNISPNKSEKIHKKFSEPDWFLMTDELFRCTECDKRRIVVLRKHWKNMGRVFHRWSISCLECDKTGESRDFNPELIDRIHESLENTTPVEKACPDCSSN